MGNNNFPIRYAIVISDSTVSSGAVHCIMLIIIYAAVLPVVFDDTPTTRICWLHLQAYRLYQYVCVRRLSVRAVKPSRNAWRHRSTEHSVMRCEATRSHAYRRVRGVEDLLRSLRSFIVLTIIHRECVRSIILIAFSRFVFEM